MLATISNKLRWSFRKNWPDLYGLIAGHYPGFVFQHRATPNLQRGEIPVFVFHSVAPQPFRGQLEFLRENKYRTLSGDELLQVLRGERAPQENEIVLTFDDGTASLYTIAYPLLQEFGFRGISFLIPGCIPDAAPGTATYQDFAGGNADAAALLAREKGEFPLCSWEEIREMHASGVIDFQAHSMYHHLVQVSPQLVDFIHPGYDFYFYANIHVPVYYRDEAPDYSREAAWGTPVHRAEPRLAGRPQYFDSERARQACVTYVAGNGGTAFFRKPGWRKQLAAVYRREVEKNGRGAFESPQAMYADILQDFKTCKQAIEARLEKKTVQHFCFPWFIGSDIAVRAAREAGFTALYWGIRREKRSNRVGDDPLYISRLEDRYIYRLPGKGRKPLADILSAKIRANVPRFRERLGLAAGA